MSKMIPFGVGDTWYLLHPLWMFVSVIAWLCIAEIYLKNRERVSRVFRDRYSWLWVSSYCRFRFQEPLVW